MFSGRRQNPGSGRRQNPGSNVVLEESLLNVAYDRLHTYEYQKLRKKSNIPEFVVNNLESPDPALITQNCEASGNE